MDALSSWQFRMEHHHDEKWLTHEGEDEMIELAERLRKRFPQLLTQPYSTQAYYVGTLYRRISQIRYFIF